MKYIVMVEARPTNAADAAEVRSGMWKSWDMWATAIEAECPEDAAEAMAKGQNWSEQRLVAVIPSDQALQFWVKPERIHKAEKTGEIVKGMDY